MKKTGLFVLTLLMCGAVASNQPLGYKGLPFGAAKTELLAKFPDLECRPTTASFKSLGDENCMLKLGPTSPAASQLYSYAGQPLNNSAAFGIADGRFERFFASFDPVRYEAIKNAVAQGIGPGVESIRTLQTMGGATIQSRVFRVSMANGSIVVTEHAGQIDEGAVLGRSAAFEAWEKKRATEQVRDGAKDL